MTCALRCTKLLTILICILPTQIGCCSHNTNDMITLMAQDPNFRNNPCYIQWKADQDAKLSRLFADRDKLERSMAEYNRISEANRKQEQLNRQMSYLSTNKVEKKKESSVWKVLGAIAGIIIGMCCCAACFSALTSENDETTPNLQTNLNPGGSTAPLPVSILTNISGSNQETRNVLLTANDTHLFMPETEGPMLPSSSWQRETNVPLLPRGVIKRQDSLPSYDDAIKMPSAPPKD